MPIVYDLDGNPHEKLAIDCRECCQEMGWSMTAPGDTPPPDDDVIADQFSVMSVAELRGWLDEHNRPYPSPCKKADLQAICRA